jgi:HSP20 family protein
MGKQVDVHSLGRDIRSHLDRARQVLGGTWGQQFLEPAVDVYQTDSEVVVVAEIAGIQSRDIDIEIEGGRLTIHGERCPVPGDTQRLYSQMEIATGQFRRTVTLPAEVNPEHAQAVYKDGVLEVVLPKAGPVYGAHLRIVVR